MNSHTPDQPVSNSLTATPGVVCSEFVSLREKAEASLHHWQRTREDCNRVDHRQNCDFQICWLRGYMRAIDDICGKQANNKLSGGEQT